MVKFKTHYDNLNVSQNAPASVIKAAYKVLCQNYHPDKYAGGPEEALRVMKIINVAYAILSDTDKRAKYDQWLNQQERQRVTDEAQRIRTIITQTYAEPRVSTTEIPSAHLAVINKFREIACLIGDKVRHSRVPLFKKINGTHWRIVAAGVVLAATFAYLADLKTADAPVNQEIAGILTKAKRLVKRGQVAKALPLYLQLAEQGNVDAQFQAGMIYAMGNGIAEDDKQASAWIGKAAEQGHREAQTKLGFMYATGKGVAQNSSSTIYWFYKAAEQGDPTAQYNLGLIYAQGQGVAKDERLAFSWYSKAAGSGDALAEYKLGDMYENGVGVAKDSKLAADWYRKAAEQGAAEAVAALKRVGEEK